MMARNIFSLLCFVLSNSAFGQNETSNWCFGNRCTLNFSQGVQNVLENNAIKTLNGSAVISDRLTGNLLFYTDGRNFWSRNHQVMQNVHTLPFHCVSLITQPAIIIPSTQDSSLFHAFCIRASHEIPPNNPTSCLYSVDKSQVPEGESGLNLYYFLVDMTQDGGLGNIIEERSNVFIKSNITQKLTAIPHENGLDYWVLIHEWKTNRFYAFLWTEEGIQDTVITDIGSIHGDYGGIYFEDEVQGEMKASPNGHKIACAVFSGYRPFDLFDFDASTGKLSNYVILGTVKGQYGVSFSPDNSKLYVSSDGRDNYSDEISIIVQFDLQSGDLPSIIASGKSLIIDNEFTNIPSNGIFPGWDTPEKGMALAKDGKLYISGNTFSDSSPGNILVVVSKPNQRGFDASINYKIFDFEGSKTGIGLPNFMQSYFNGLVPATECEGNSNVKIAPNPFDDTFSVDVLSACPEKEFTLAIYNSVGQLVFIQNEVKSGEQIQAGNLADSTYFIKLTSDSFNKTIRAVKITK